jgi:hypothetical protein
MRCRSWRVNREAFASALSRTAPKDVKPQDGVSFFSDYTEDCVPLVAEGILAQPFLDIHDRVEYLGIDVHEPVSDRRTDIDGHALGLGRTSGQHQTQSYLDQHGCLQP